MTLGTYDRIGSDYRLTRKEDPRLARLVVRELRGASTVLNVGAGTGSYEPTDRFVVAVEPSWVMLRQRPATAGPSAQAIAERLPFQDDAFDAAMAVLTVHHWANQRAGLRELGRVARELIVLLTWDPASAYWRRPSAYLNADVRKGIWSFASCRDVSPLQRLAEDLETGEWHRRYGDLLAADELDIGYRLGRPKKGLH